MNDSSPSMDPAQTHSREELLTAMFAQMVLQQANMAFIFLGKAPHPQTGESKVDLEHAQYFIDQLEMLEARTKGNLSKEEAGLLKQSLTATRMAFVDAVSNPPSAEPAAAPAPAPAQPAAPSEPPAAAPIDTGTDESRKKFSKKY